MTRPVLLSAIILVSTCGAQESIEAIKALEAAVDLETPDARQRAAVLLARRKGITLQDWLRITRTFGRFEAQEPGVSRHLAKLIVDGNPEDTELFVYVPRDYNPATPAAALLMSHGTGGSGGGQTRMWRDVADRIGMLVLAPSEAGPNAGYAFTRRERLAALAALRWARRRFNVDENRVFATGISRGGHLTWDLALRYPDRLAAIAPMIGGPRWNIAEGQNNLRYLENVAHLPIRDLQGANDDPRLLFNLRWAFDILDHLGAANCKLIEFPGLGHSFDMTAVDWQAFFGAATRDPQPTRITLRAARKDEARAYWVEISSWEKDVRETFRPVVRAEQWDALDDAGRRKLIQSQADDRTARLEISLDAPGRFTARSKTITGLRLLLGERMLPPDGKIQVEFRGRTIRRKARPSVEVLLREFVDRFDRTFLPIAEVTVR